MNSQLEGVAKDYGNNISRSVEEGTLTIQASSENLNFDGL
jgi:hypothetical protein